MFYVAAHALSHMVSEEDLNRGLLLSSVENIRNVSERVALAVAKEARDSGLGINRDDITLKKMIRKAMWTPKYLPYRYVKPGSMILVF